MLIGLTGQIGSGKTTVAGILAGLGACVLDADEIGKQVVDESKQLREKLARRFGNEILDRNGRVKRKKLANLAFACQESKKNLNQLVHPFLLAELRRQIRVATKKYDLIVVDAMEFIITNGPGGPGELKKLDKVVAGTDIVAVDAMCCEYVNYSPDQIVSIIKAHEVGLGEIDYQKLLTQL